MRAFHVAGLVTLLLWQIAPVPAHDAPRRGGPFRLGFAYATGDWENASFDCQGDLTDSWAVQTRSAGARFDYLAGNSPLRLTAVAGRWWMDGAPGYAVPTQTQDFAGAQVVLEDHSIGLGFGALSNPVTDESKGIVASAYLRWGSLDKLHLQIDVNPPTETPGMMGTVRAGVGFGQGFARRTGGFVGLAFGPFMEELQQAVLVADLAIPLSRHLDVLVRGNYGPGAGTPQWAAGLGVRTVW